MAQELLKFQVRCHQLEMAIERFPLPLLFLRHTTVEEANAAARTLADEPMTGRPLAHALPWLAQAITEACPSHAASIHEATTPDQRIFRAHCLRLNDQGLVLVLLHEETELHRQTQAMAAAKADIERVFDTIADLVFETDREGRIVRANLKLTLQAA